MELVTFQAKFKEDIRVRTSGVQKYNYYFSFLVPPGSRFSKYSS